MVVKVAGSSIDSKAVQPSKKLTGRVFCVTGRMIFLRLVQNAKAYVPNDFTEGGSTTVSNRLMFLQRYAGMVCTWSPNVNFVTFELVL